MLRFSNSCFSSFVAINMDGHSHDHELFYFTIISCTLQFPPLEEGELPIHFQGYSPLHFLQVPVWMLSLANTPHTTPRQWKLHATLTPCSCYINSMQLVWVMVFTGARNPSEPLCILFCCALKGRGHFCSHSTLWMTCWAWCRPVRRRVCSFAYTHVVLPA